MEYLARVLQASFFDEFLRPCLFAAPLFAMSLLPLALTKVGRFKDKVLGAELVFATLLGVLFGYLTAKAPIETITQSFTALAGVLTFFGVTILRQKRIPDESPRLDAIYVLGVLSIVGFLVAAEYTAKASFVFEGK